MTGEGTQVTWEGRATILLDRTVEVPYFYGSNSHADGLETTIRNESKDNIIKKGEDAGKGPRIFIEVRMKRKGFWSKFKDSAYTGLLTMIAGRGKSNKDLGTDFGFGFATEWLTSEDVGELQPEIAYDHSEHLAFDPVPYYDIWTGYYRQAVKGRVDHSRAIVYGTFAGVYFEASHRSHSHIDLPDPIFLHEGAH